MCVFEGSSGKRGVGLVGAMTFVASCGLGQCLQSQAEEPLAKHAPIPASITRACAINIIIQGARLF